MELEVSKKDSWRKSCYHKGSMVRVSRMPIQEVAGEPEEKGPLKKSSGFRNIADHRPPGSHSQGNHLINVNYRYFHVHRVPSVLCKSLVLTVLTFSGGFESCLRSHFFSSSTGSAYLPDFSAPQVFKSRLSDRRRA